MIDVESTREAFEERAFAERFLCSIERVRWAEGFPMLSVDCPTKKEFVKRDSKGNYEDVTLAAMWWGWSEAIAHRNKHE
jgi:hypothetical protein